MSDDHRDPSPVSPAHLAIGRSLNQLPDVHEDSLEMSSKRIMERYLYLQRLFKHYWKHWKQEYLQQLTVRNKCHKEEAPIKVGDIVLVSDDKVSRGKWLLARVEKVHLGRHNIVRTATARTEKSVLCRSVQHLHRLEVESATPQVIPDEVRLHGGEKNETNIVHSKTSTLPVNELDCSVVLSNRGQGGENVTASKKPEIVDLWVSCGIT